MNLYLSSYRIGDSGAHLARWGSGRTALLISNALDFSTDTERLKMGREQEVARLSDLGIQSEALDLRHYSQATESLRDRVRDAGMLWVVGGNTFLLRKAMAISGLDQILWGMRDNEDFVYGGYSAGACVLSPSLKGIHLADEPKAQAAGYQREPVWDGLGILDYYIVPHYRCDHYESDKMEAVAEYYRHSKLPFRTLADGEVILDNTQNKQKDKANKA